MHVDQRQGMSRVTCDVPSLPPWAFEHSGYSLSHGGHRLSPALALWPQLDSIVIA